MKISDFMLRYQTDMKLDGLCRIRVFGDGTKPWTVVATDTGKNPSTAPEYSLEMIDLTLRNQGFLLAEANYLLHDESDSGWCRFTWAGGELRDYSKWKTMRRGAVERMLACPREEFQTLTMDDHRLRGELMRMVAQINPFFDYPYPPAPEVVKRRLEILENRISKKELQALVEQGAGERELQAFIKKDLSLMAEATALPPEEYICFSEFPVGDGRVDFAVFSSRSWMSVTLVEVKGADFNLCTGSGEIKLSSTAEKAYRQLEKRQRYSYMNYREFTTDVHDIRAGVEAGAVLHNSLLGPKGKLDVDPDKGIRLYYLMICGRTSEDLLESEIRHTREENGLPNIRIESWDTFLRKLQRA